MASRRKLRVHLPAWPRGLVLALVFLFLPLARARAATPSMRQMREMMFKAMLEAGEAAPRDRENVVGFYDVRLADLNGDGRPEYFLTGPCEKICRCRVFAYDPEKGMDLMLSADCMREGLTVLDGPGEGGFKMLMAPIASYAAGGVKRFYGFSGGKYRLRRKECFAFTGEGGALIRTDCPKGMP